MRRRRFLASLATAAVATSVTAGCSGASGDRSGVSQSATAGRPTFFFRPVLCTVPPQDSHVQDPAPAETACHTGNPGLIATSSGDQDTATSAVIVPYFMGGVRYVLGPADLTGGAVKSAKIIQAENLSYEVEVTLTPSGTQEFNRIAAQRYPYYLENTSNPPFQSREAIEAGDTVFAAFPIEARSYGGMIIIDPSGTSLDDAQYIAGAINQTLKSTKR